jgi:basic amino acid/polyamine antiporter, APA family
VATAIVVADMVGVGVLTHRPLQSALGTLIMISGLLIYAIFRKRADGHAIVTPGRE